MTLFFEPRFPYLEEMTSSPCRDHATPTMKFCLHLPFPGCPAAGGGPNVRLWPKERGEEVGWHPETWPLKAPCDLPQTPSLLRKRLQDS